MRNLRLDICYDGTRYRGWQRLANTENTIQFKLEQTLSRILNEPVEVIGSGRTDAGTHAVHQVANFHCHNEMACDEILVKLRSYLPEDIGIYSCKDASVRFHARLNAKQKTYVYRIWNSDSPCIFERKYLFCDARAVDLDRMQDAVNVFIGTHDFSAFCANKNMKKSTVRSISAFTVERIGDELRFTVTGNGFLHHMVRILVGTVLEVGRGERTLESLPDLFGGRRECAGTLLPSCGLCLMEVFY